MSDETTVTVRVPEDPPAGEVATALAAGAAQANAQHAQAAAAEAQATAEAAAATAAAALERPPGLTPEEVREIARAAALEALETSLPEDPPEEEVVQVSVPDPLPNDAPLPIAEAPTTRRAHPVMRMFLGRQS